MITLTINQHIYHIPSKWEECDAATFSRLARAMWNFEMGHTDFESFRIEIVAACLGVDIPSTRLTDFLGVNFYSLSELLTFPYTLHYNSDGTQTAFVEVVMQKNLYTQIRDIEGYKYDTDAAGVIDTTLNAAQYTSGISLLNLQASYIQNYREDLALQLLDTLMRLLYNGQSVANIDERIAVMYNFRGITESIRRDSSYDLIFRKAGQKAEPSPVGSNSGIFVLAKAGYGDFDSVSKMDVHTFLSAMVQQTVDSIHTLQGSGMKPGKIAQKLNLDVEQVLPFTTVSEEEE
ncbi:MAG: hypothetical protein ACI3Z0_03180 [Candidatus Cryptobacteroides sp.]